MSVDVQHGIVEITSVEHADGSRLEVQRHYGDRELCIWMTDGTQSFAQLISIDDAFELARLLINQSVAICYTHRFEIPRDHLERVGETCWRLIENLEIG